MRKWLIGIVAVIIVVIAALIVVPFLIPTETYKGQIVERVKSATGRDLALNGPISLSVLPSFGLTVSDVAFGNAPGASNKNMATFGKLQLQVQPIALLSGKLVIDRFVLVDPVIALEVDKQGRPNWQFATAPAQPAASGTPPAARPAPSPATGAKPAGRTAGPVDEIHLGDVRLVNGTITYLDARTGQKQQVDKIDAKLVLPDLGSPMQASGNADWNGKTVSLALDLATPREFLSGAKTAVTVKLAAPAVKFDFKGNVASADQIKLDGETVLDISSLRELANWTGGTLPPTSGGLGPLKIAGKLDVVGAKVNFSGAQIALDAINAKGDLAVDASGVKPVFKGALDVDKLDLNPYLPPQPASPAAAAPSAPTRAAPSAGAPAPAPTTPAPAATAAGWSDQPINMSGLQAANADFALTVGGLVFKKITIGKSALSLQLKDGKLAADLTRMELYEGSGKGDVRLDGAAAVPALEASFDLAKVQAAPLLHDVMDFDRLRGNANGNVAVTAHGKSERELIANLGGKGALDFLDGAIKGINIGALIRNPAGALVDPASQKDQETDFSEMSGTFTITNGIFKNTDLELKAPLLRVAGAGTIDLPQRTMNYRIDPKVAMTAQGQGGKSDAAGIEVPVLIEGPWDHLTYRPQLDALLKDPSKAVEGIKNLFGKPSSSPPASGAPPATGTPPAPNPTANPADLLKGLFGGKKN